VAALRRQLGAITGKTHMVEFAFGGTGHNSHWGAPYNPWDTVAHRAPGGSSSGAGVSLLEGSALLAFGSDTAGSVRIPACMTGTVGLKVTLGRWSADGVVPLSPTFDTPGLLARSVCDVAYGFAALDPAGIDPGGFIARAGTRDLAGVRIGVGDPFLWRDCDPGIAETAHEAVDALARAGAVTREFTLPEAEAAYTLFLQGSLSAIELRSFLDRELPDWLAQLDPVIAPAVRNAERVSATDYLARLARLRALARSAAPRLDAVDVIASPTLCLTPPLMSDVADADSHLRVNRRIVRNTVAANYLGLCAITLPVGRDRAGMPVGLQLINCTRQCGRSAACDRACGGAGARHRRRPDRDAAAAGIVRLFRSRLRRSGCSAPPPTGSGRRRCWRREITAPAACTRDAGCRAP
jgi:aspartyl-tRNA(Asn)/glutamyl-tRNA(Gln) amidotransferase subunit A